jgi:hypothetical protein
MLVFTTLVFLCHSCSEYSTYIVYLENYIQTISQPYLQDSDSSVLRKKFRNICRFYLNWSAYIAILLPFYTMQHSNAMGSFCIFYLDPPACNIQAINVYCILSLKVGTNENGSACGRWLSIGI